MEIFDHDAPETITFKNNSIELENWISHLSYIEKEIENLLNLSKIELSNTLMHTPVLTKLAIKKEENGINLRAFKKYKDSIGKATECEDAQCDMYYVNEHEKYRKIYMCHLQKYRKVKEEYFNVLTR